MRQTLERKEMQDEPLKKIMENINRASFNSRGIEIQTELKKLKSFVEKILEEKIVGEPKVLLFPIRYKVKDKPPLAIQRRDVIEILSELKNENEIKYVLYHEYLHWVIHRRLGKRSGFDKIPDDCPLAFPFLVVLVETLDNGRKLNFIEEGTCNLFAAILISENKEKSIAKNIFFFFPFEKAKLNSAIEKVYDTLSKIDETTIDETTRMNKNVRRIIKMRNELAELLSFSQRGATVYIGYIIALFAYEMYKEEGKETIQLLRDLLFSPYTVTEQVIHRIKSDKDRRLLKNSLFDLSNEFANCLR